VWGQVNMVGGWSPPCHSLPGVLQCHIRVDRDSSAKWSNCLSLRLCLTLHICFSNLSSASKYNSLSFLQSQILCGFSPYL
jgi:hypothetical protein